MKAVDKTKPIILDHALTDETIIFRRFFIINKSKESWICW